MYETFFTDIEPRKFQNLEALGEMLEKRPSYHTQVVDPSTVSLGNDGLINYGDSKSKMSLQGFRNMMVKLYRIPDPFATRIPLDLLQYNIKELGNELDFNMTFVFNDQGLLINAVKEELLVLPSMPLLETFKDYKVKSILYSDIALNIQALNPNFTKSAEPRVGDITQVGLNFTNSETGFSYPKAENLLWTLKCSNGAIAPRRFGLVKLKIKNADSSIESMTRTFSRRLGELLLDGESMVNRLNGLADLKMSNSNAAWIVKAISRVIGKDEALGIFELDQAEFTDIKELARDEVSKDELTELDAWETYSKVTSLANDYLGETRKKLQTLGGKFLELDQLGGRVSLN